MSDERAIAAVKLARASLMLKYPYFASALARMPVVVTDLPMPTMAVDKRWRLYVHPAVAEWDPYTTRMVLYHELLHLVVGHPARMELISRQHGTSLANLAADIEVNWRLREEGWELLEDAATPEAFGLPGGLLAEDYARLLVESGAETGLHLSGAMSPGASGSGSCGIWQPWELGETDDPGIGSEQPGVSAEEAEALRKAIARSIQDAVREWVQAGLSLRQPGAVPGHLRRWAEAMAQPEEDPLSVLGALVGAAIGKRGGRQMTWLRPSRRSACTPLPLPGKRRVAPAVAIVLDTSGSMEDKEIARGLGLVTRLAHSLGCPVTVLCVDAEVKSVQRNVTYGAQVVPLGGGGTNMAAGILAAARLVPKPEVIVVFTDGWTIAWPDVQPPGTTVIVALTSPAAKDDVPPWAKIVCLTT